MYDDILLPTDGSAGAEDAIDHAMHAAVQNGAVVHAVHVVELAERGEGDAAERSADAPASDAPELLEPILTAADEAGVATVDAVLEGTAHRRLLEYVEESAVDLVVMGTHGKSGVSRVLLGSTAETVVRHSPVPVLTVRSEKA